MQQWAPSCLAIWARARFCKLHRWFYHEHLKNSRTTAPLEHVLASISIAVAVVASYRPRNIATCFGNPANLWVDFAPQ
eukprot:2939425-Lingulodinium_polyedra.AAC.1